MNTSKLISELNTHLNRSDLYTWAQPSTSWYFERVARTITDACNSKPNKVLIVGITGYAGSGKDTGVELLQDLGNVYHDWSVRTPNGYAESTPCKTTTGLLKSLRCSKIAFAQPLKQIAMAVGFTFEQCYDPKLKNEIDPFWGISPRQFLQMCGTEMFRNVWRDDIWVELCRKKILDFRKESDYPGILLITDVRFPNERDMIKSEGGIVLRIKREGQDHFMNHASENQIDKLQVDRDILNDAASPEAWSIKFLTELCKQLNSTAFFN